MGIKPDPVLAEGSSRMTGKQMNRSMRKDYLKDKSFDRRMGGILDRNPARPLNRNLLGAPQDLGPLKKKFIPYRKGGRQ